MNKQEAKAILSKQIDDLRKVPYRELLTRLDKSEGSVEITGKSGTVYQLEIQIFWDDKKQRNLRVSVSIDDRGWQAFFPLTDSFIVAPDGTFIGE